MKRSHQSHAIDEELLTNGAGVAIVRVARYLTELAHSNFFGNVLIKFEAGEVVLVKKEQTLKLDELDN